MKNNQAFFSPVTFDQNEDIGKKETSIKPLGLNCMETMKNNRQDMSVTTGATPTPRGDAAADTDVDW